MKVDDSECSMQCLKDPDFPTMKCGNANRNSVYQFISNYVPSQGMCMSVSGEISDKNGMVIIVSESEDKCASLCDANPSC